MYVFLLNSPNGVHPSTLNIPLFLLQIITDYVYELLEKEGLERISIPVSKTSDRHQ